MQNRTTNQFGPRFVADHNGGCPTTREALEDFRQARDTLKNYICQLEAELAAAKAALDGEPTPVAVIIASTPQCRRGKKYPYGSLTAAVVDLLKDGSKTKRQIVEGLGQAGFQFFGKKPLVVLDSVLYTKRFWRSGKLFSLAGEKNEGRN